MPVALRRRSWDEQEVHGTGLRYSSDDLDISLCPGISLGGGLTKAGCRERCSSLQEFHRALHSDGLLSGQGAVNGSRQGSGDFLSMTDSSEALTRFLDEETGDGLVISDLVNGEWAGAAQVRALDDAVAKEMLHDQTPEHGDGREPQSLCKSARPAENPSIGHDLCPAKISHKDSDDDDDVDVDGSIVFRAGSKDCNPERVTLRPSETSEGIPKDDKETSETRCLNTASYCDAQVHPHSNTVDYELVPAENWNFASNFNMVQGAQSSKAMECINVLRKYGNAMSDANPMGKIPHFEVVDVQLSQVKYDDVRSNNSLKAEEVTCSEVVHIQTRQEDHKDITMEADVVEEVSHPVVSAAPDEHGGESQNTNSIFESQSCKKAGCLSRLAAYNVDTLKTESSCGGPNSERAHVGMGFEENGQVTSGKQTARAELSAEGDVSDTVLENCGGAAPVTGSAEELQCDGRSAGAAENELTGATSENELTGATAENELTGATSENDAIDEDPLKAPDEGRGTKTRKAAESHDHSAEYSAVRLRVKKVNPPTPAFTVPQQRHMMQWLSLRAGALRLQSCRATGCVVGVVNGDKRGHDVTAVKDLGEVKWVLVTILVCAVIWGLDRVRLVTLLRTLQSQSTPCFMETKRPKHEMHIIGVPFPLLKFDVGSLPKVRSTQAFGGGEIKRGASLFWQDGHTEALKESNLSPDAIL
ncbi:hypothetical protein JZ751_016421 [Albula glossodonta]|uniref:Uncharacterized protein n=1 Tax=Albula glossodonta TaxID=121402 RepID=A0A8T2NQA3_9TELE|nr:hypothetical protein JZ751_016421 [Albula glossodonta]